MASIWWNPTATFLIEELINHTGTKEWNKHQTGSYVDEGLIFSMWVDCSELAS